MYVYVPLVEIDSVPWAGEVCAVTVSAEPPSLARTDAPCSTVFTVVIAASLVATGVTVIVTVDVAVCAEASVVV